MAASSHTAVRAVADLHLRVPRGAAGDMHRGVRDVLERIEGVDGVVVHDLRGVNPRSLDLYVDANVGLELAFDGADDPDRVAARVRDGFGVERVDAVVVDG